MTKTIRTLILAGVAVTGISASASAGSLDWPLGHEVGGGFFGGRSIERTATVPASGVNAGDVMIEQTAGIDFNQAAELNDGVFSSTAYPEATAGAAQLTETDGGISFNRPAEVD